MLLLQGVVAMLPDRMAADFAASVHGPDEALGVGYAKVVTLGVFCRGEGVCGALCELIFGADSVKLLPEAICALVYDELLEVLHSRRPFADTVASMQPSSLRVTGTVPSVPGE